jgi:glycosyltransferase involved in cell wall biosynthesis
MRNEEKLISVIIPVYNVAPYVEKCVRSVAGGSYENLEILCIDDGSTDGSGKLLDTLAKEDPRIRVVHQENRGLSGARNRGLAEAKGEYIAPVDSDDFVHPMYFESMMRCMKEKKASLVICEYQHFQEGEDPAYADASSASYRRLDCREFSGNAHARNMTWGRIYRRKDIGSIRYAPEVHMTEDTLFNLSVVSNMVRPVIYMTDFPMYYYLNRLTSLVHTGKKEKYCEIGKWYLDHHALVEQGSWNYLVCLQAVKMTLAYRYLTSFQTDRKERTREANRMLRACLGRLRCDKKTWFLHAVMYLLPPLYRAYRIKDDPTMLIWEKRQRQSRKDERMSP